ncbi:hypothetical protein [Paenarthrobacter aromaticivorans]|uniref:hypothetical protein n=1 Tax=Paenarthrobacter aromaticivorans TaxID=2849150 RepID=UPI003A809923
MAGAYYAATGSFDWNGWHLRALQGEASIGGAGGPDSGWPPSGDGGQALNAELGR